MRIEFKRLLVSGVPMYLILFLILIEIVPQYVVPKAIEDIAENLLFTPFIYIVWYTPYLATMLELIGLVRCHDIGCFPTTPFTILSSIIVSIVLYLFLSLLSKRKGLRGSTV